MKAKNSIQQKEKEFIERLKNYQFPQCSLGGDHEHHQLNKLCVDQHCQKKKLFEPICIICEEYNVHKVQNHITKPLKLVLKELIQLISQTVQDNNQANKIVVIEHQFNQIAQHFKLISDRCQKLSNDIYQSLDIFRMTINKESQKKIELNKIIDFILNDDNKSDKKLRMGTQNLHQIIAIENGNFTLNDIINENIKLTLIKNSEKYLQVMSDSFQKINKIIESLLEISVLEGYDEFLDNQISQSSNVEIEGLNQQQLQMLNKNDSQDVQQYKKENADKIKQKIEQQIRDHIIKCQCENCQEFQPNFGIGNWRLTDCYYGKKLSEEWLKIANI